MVQLIKLPLLLLGLSTVTHGFTPIKTHATKRPFSISVNSPLYATDSNDKDKESTVGIMDQPSAWNTPGDFTSGQSSSSSSPPSSSTTSSSSPSTTPQQPPPESEPSETKKLLQKVKDAGVAGAISYAAWELAFWGISIPICIVGYRQLAGHWPDLGNSEDLQKVGAEAFAFVNFARFAVPLRIGLALSTVGWVEENVVKRFMTKDEGEEEED